MIQFLLNNKTIKTELKAGSTVLDFVRYQKRLMGTKIGCREGDCGACTILVGDFEKGELVYRSMTSCLMPLGNAHGKHILTVEGINMESLSPVQQIFADNNGAQCGFCTIGFIMSLSGFALSNEEPNSGNAIAAIDGNICRCTGYKSIERAANEICLNLQKKPKLNRIPWLVENKFLPDYFSGISTKLSALKNNISQNGSLEKAGNQKIGGGTDLMVQKPGFIKKSNLQFLIDNQYLKGIELIEDHLEIGGNTTVTEFGESLLVQKYFPDIKKHLKLVSSTPIRNMATMAGNIVNASPIGDMSIFFLALNSHLILEKDNKTRTVKLQDFFKGYKQIDLAENEFIQKIIFPVPHSKDHFNFEKVSKRTHLDIASVNAACLLKFGTDKLINEAHLSAGGVAPIPKYLSQTSEFLVGKNLSAQTIAEALEILNNEIAPISDARGSSDYKRLLLKQLVIAHFLNLIEEKEISKILNQ